MKRVTILLAVAGLLLAAGMAAAQSGGDYDLTWNTVDGGGYTFSQGGSYLLGGTAGQSDAGAMSAGSYVLGGGFWMGGAMQEQVKHVLTVSCLGAGSGHVSSVPAGIDCGDGGNDCLEDYEEGTLVTLTATGSGGSTFDGWGGACSGTGPTCQVTMDADKAVTASFAGAGTQNWVYLPMVMRDTP